ncbi:MAG: hypothetical protein R2712_06595 [Vicinamibacterales bacterium]
MAPLCAEQSVAAPTTRTITTCRMVALARLALPGVGAVQIDWQQCGCEAGAGGAHLRRQSHLDGVS